MTIQDALEFTNGDIDKLILALDHTVNPETGYDIVRYAHIYLMWKHIVREIEAKQNGLG